MKFKNLSLIFVLLLITGCASVKHNLYESTAKGSYISNSIETNFIVMRGKNSKLKYPGHFGIIAANDNKTLKYTLIAPSKIMGRILKLNDFKLGYATPLSDGKLVELIEKVTDAIDHWGKKYPDYKGYNVLFRIEGDESKMSFHFQNGNDGALAYIKISNGKKYVYINAPNDNVYESVFSYRLESIKELKGFKELLVSSHNEQNFGYKENEKPKKWFE